MRQPYGKASSICLHGKLPGVLLTPGQQLLEVAKTGPWPFPQVMRKRGSLWTDGERGQAGTEERRGGEKGKGSPRYVSNIAKEGWRGGVEEKEEEGPGTQEIPWTFRYFQPPALEIPGKSMDVQVFPSFRGNRRGTLKGFLCSSPWFRRLKSQCLLAALKIVQPSTPTSLSRHHNSPLLSLMPDTASPLLGCRERIPGTSSLISLSLCSSFSSSYPPPLVLRPPGTPLLLGPHRLKGTQGRTTNVHLLH